MRKKNGRQMAVMWKGWGKGGGRVGSYVKGQVGSSHGEAKPCEIGALQQLL
jgi:hypothetical protein